MPSFWNSLSQLNLAEGWAFHRLIRVAAEDNTVFGFDMSIESLRSQEYSYFIFGFLVVALILFGIIVYLYLPRKKGRLKLGEKIMFGSIVVGMVIAVLFGWLQLVEGYLV
ncbi:MAG TPA: hypothetical protein ENJ19_06670 [Gammaproteobacteria bacterium]|nr:hypothetical protein [Gammaproteobacteria bacterium]